ncbi:MAG TPA: cation:proton antiporter [Opitutaceae bacterium]|nr:cation:proton antiporter [Opitutaceae bacterium]
MHGIDFIQDLAVILAVAALVGWVCQRIGLSVVVGFLVAGIVVGPHTPPFSLVTDPDRIDTAAQVGLVFLMFGIGLRLSVRKLRRLGPALLAAVAASALVMYFLSRLLGLALGWNNAEGLFLAGMLMISSSAIISKILHETGATHERSGQLAMGVSVLEDVVAVVMLTLLNSLVQFGAGDHVPVMETLAKLGAFIALAGVAGLIVVPWLLKRMSIAADEELQTLGIAGLLFALALVAQRAGYSLALGAFLLGTIVAETPHRPQVERTFEGMRDVFSAVFFVAIGMQIDLHLLWHSGWLIVGVAVFTFAARTLAATTGLTLIGTPPRDALRAGMAVTPIGEFSFIIAQLGVTHEVVPPAFYPLAVGVSLLTTLAAPMVTRRSEAIAAVVLARQPRWLETFQQYYQNWLERIRRRQARNLLWQLSRKRIAQVGIGMLFVTGLVVFSEQLYGMTRAWLGRDWLFPHGLEVIFWLVLILVILAPLVAIWRNVSAMALLYAEVSTKGHARQKVLRPIVETSLKLVAGTALFLWLLTILPDEGTAKWLLLLSAIFAAAALFLLRRRLIYWHSELEVELQEMLATDGNRMTATTAPWLRPHEDWNLHIADCLLPDLADCQGRRIEELGLRAKFGCSVVGIERQGFMIPLPPPDTVLYPRDKVLLMGTVEQVQAGKKFLGTVSGAPAALSAFEEASMEALAVPAWSRAVSHTLGEIGPMKAYGVLVAGVNRGGVRILNPRAEEVLQAGDEVLALGTPEQIRNFRDWLREEPAGDGEAGK